MDISKKTLGLKLLSTDDGDHTFSAIVSTYNVVDSYGERMMFGCYGGSLEKKMPVGVASHDWTKPVFTTVCKELAPGDALLDGDGIDEETRKNGGLYVEGKFFSTQDAQDTYVLMRDGGFREFSVGYTVIRDGWGEDGIREVHEVELHEVSPVLVGANPKTQLIEIKSVSDYNDHIVALGTEITKLVARTKTRVEMRTKAQRGITERDKALLDTLADGLSTAEQELRRILAGAEPEKRRRTKSEVREIIKALTEGY